MPEVVLWLIIILVWLAVLAVWGYLADRERRPERTHNGAEEEVIS